MLQKLMLIGVLMLHACDRGEPAAEPPAPDAAWRPRLVLLYVPCTVNKDYLAPYSSAVPYTPHLARFAKEAVVFERHQTEAGQSAIAYASILSGGQADHHGIYTNGGRPPERVSLMHEVYAEHGWEPFVWAGHPAMHSYSRGVQPGHKHNRTLQADDPAFLEVLNRLRVDPTYRAFVFVSLAITHGPYRLSPLERFRKRFPSEAASQADTDRYAQLYTNNHFALSWNFANAIRRLGLEPAEVPRLAATVETLYKSNVHELDRTFGAIRAAIDSRGLLDESLIVFTADHGEVMYRETTPFQWTHGKQLAPEVLNVPLMVSSPALPAYRYEAVTRSMDLYPTLLSLSGIAPPEVPGTDLSTALLRRAEPPRQLAPSHTTVLALSVFRQMYNEEHRHDWALVRHLFPEVNPDLMWVSIRDGDRIYKYRNLDGRNWGFQVFDLSTDHDETRNLYDEEDPTHRQMATELLAYKSRLLGGYRGRVFRAPADAPRSDPEEVEMMRSLGYIQ